MWILAKIKVYLAGLSVLLGVIAFAFLRGRQSAKVEQGTERLRSYVETRQEIDQAQDAVDGAGGGRKWLLQRKHKHDGSM